MPKFLLIITFVSTKIIKKDYCAIIEKKTSLLPRGICIIRIFSVKFNPI